MTFRQLYLVEKYNLSTQKPKPLLLILTDTKSHGGISNFNKNLINSLHNYRLTIIALNDDKRDQKIKGFRGNKAQFLFSIISHLLLKPQLAIIGHLHFTPIAVFCKLVKVKNIALLHGIEAWKPKPSLVKYLPHVNEYWAVSNYTKSKFEEETKTANHKVKLIFNTLPKQSKDNEVEKYKSHYFLSVARLDENEKYKGIDITLRSLVSIKNWLISKNWTFEIVASGNDLKRHLVLVESLGLGEIVNFHTNLDDQSLNSLYKNCTFFALPSSGEGFGIVYLEAMMHKKAIIGAINCGSEDVIVDGKTGFLIEPTEEKIRNKIEYLINNPDKRKTFGLNGYRHFRDNFSNSKFNELINKLVITCVG